jgi:hypothetical protein
MRGVSLITRSRFSAIKDDGRKLSGGRIDDISPQRDPVTHPRPAGACEPAVFAISQPHGLMPPFFLKSATSPRGHPDRLGVMAVSFSAFENYCRLSFEFKPSSRSRRTASERDGLSGCLCAQSSIRAINSLGARTGSTGAIPVRGRPRFFVARKLSLTLAIFRIRKLQADGKLALATGPNPSHGVAPWLRLSAFLRQFAS